MSVNDNNCGTKSNYEKDLAKKQNEITPNFMKMYDFS